jgi:hypothetical protein
LFADHVLINDRGMPGSIPGGICVCDPYSGKPNRLSNGAMSERVLQNPLVNDEAEENAPM